MRRLEVIQRLLAMSASLFALLGTIAFFLVPGADELRTRHFVVFLVRSGLFELMVLAVLCALAWAALRLTRNVLAANFSPDVPWTARQRRVVISLALLGIGAAFLAIPAYFIGRARWLYWSQLSRPAYAMRDLGRITRLARTGRTGQAYSVAATANGVLKGTPQEDLFSGLVTSLGTRMARARELKGDMSASEAHMWNPLAHRQRYFELAEAIRLNPEEFAAAEALRIMRTGLIENALPADVRALCSPSAGSPQRRTLTVLESEIRSEELKAAGSTPRATERCVNSVSAPWALARVGCLLAISRRAQQPFTKTEEDSWTIASLPECRGVALQDVYL
jgi:hypothetical protein